MTDSYDFCIVGAGPSGLTLAHQLTQAGFRVIVVERNARAGGLAKSFDYGGNIFDIGPKRFHTDDNKVLRFIESVLGEKKLIIGRSSKVFFLGRYFDWPLTTAQLLRLPVGTALKCASDLLRRRELSDPESFQNYIEYKYGRTLYEVFFRPYTEKFLRINAHDVHAHWASTGINRTIIDKNAKGSSLFEVLEALLLPKQVKTKFIYPQEGGFGGFWDIVQALCEDTGKYEIVLSDTISGIRPTEDGFECVTSRGESFQCSKMCWTGNLNDLLGLVAATTGDSAGLSVKYLNTIFYNMVVNPEVVTKHRAQWIYVSRGDSLISRVTCMREFAAYTCRHDDYNIVCEVTDSQSLPQYWDHAEQLLERVVRELVEMKFLKSAEGVKQVYVNKQEDTYPIYHRNYLKDLGHVRRIVKECSNRLFLMGRSGAFWYNNSDHSIRMAIDMAEYFTGERSEVFDPHAYFGGESVEKDLVSSTAHGCSIHDSGSVG